MANQPFSREQMEQGIQAHHENWGRVQYRRTEGTSQNNSVATISGAGGENNNKESRNIEKSQEMLEKARIYLAKHAPQEDRQQISRCSTTVGKSKPREHIPPPMKKPRNDGEGRRASSIIEKREVARSEDVKAEIQSLVKHSLSAMHKNKKKLGTYIFLQFIFQNFEFFFMLFLI